MTVSRRLAMLSLIMALTLGCGQGEENPPTFEVSGTVTYKNKPVEGATVVLVASDPGGKGAVGNTDANGFYKVSTFGDGDGAIAGGYSVKVFKYPLVAEPPNDGDDVMTEEEEEDEYGGVEEDEPEARNELPAKYEDPSRSGFTVTVVDAPVTLDLDLN